MNKFLDILSYLLIIGLAFTVTILPLIFNI